MKYGVGQYGIGKYGDETVAGYKVFVKAGEAPDPSVDAPIATVASTETTVEIDVAFPGSAGKMHGLVVPFNEQGIGLPAAPFAFAFDAEGGVDASPSPVTNLRAKPLAGGLVELTWNYRDSDLRQKAARFEVAGTLTTESGTESLPLVLSQVLVNRNGPQVNYRHLIGPFDDGVAEIAIIAKTADGAGESDVQSVRVLVDSAAPADATLVLQAF